MGHGQVEALVKFESMTGEISSKWQLCFARPHWPTSSLPKVSLQGNLGIAICHRQTPLRFSMLGQQILVVFQLNERKSKWN